MAHGTKPRHGAASRTVLIPKSRDDAMTKLGKRVTVMGDCYVLDGKPDEYGHVHGGSAYRYVWESIHGPIGCDDHIHHVCRTKGCIRPDHLQRLTRREHYDEHADD
jgi:hypothetical protein